MAHPSNTHQNNVGAVLALLQLLDRPNMLVSICNQQQSSVVHAFPWPTLRAALTAQTEYDKGRRCSQSAAALM